MNPIAIILKNTAVTNVLHMRMGKPTRAKSFESDDHEMAKLYAGVDAVLHRLQDAGEYPEAWFLTSHFNPDVPPEAMGDLKATIFDVGLDLNELKYQFTDESESEAIDVILMELQSWVITNIGMGGQSKSCTDEGLAWIAKELCTHLLDTWGNLYRMYNLDALSPEWAFEAIAQYLNQLPTGACPAIASRNGFAIRIKDDEYYSLHLVREVADATVYECQGDQLFGFSHPSEVENHASAKDVIDLLYRCF